ncbi:c-type cytochrome biogenesis protein CcmI [Roseibium sp.]|uniref:c-type cytochrome biogenesis protein CcmI n=1 Tax=Roseibium sp. TaxID=1936156 RepID=UPI003D10B992
MTFWILIAAMTGIAALTVLVPLSRARRKADAATMNADEAVYREQLGAIDSELKRGLIDPEAAEAARTEIARRLLAAHDKHAEVPEKALGKTRLRLAQGIAIIALPLAAVGIYLLLGSPDQPDTPLALRLNAPPTEQSVDVLVARVEQHLAENPEDGQGWAVIAPVYLSLGQPQASARAYQNAIRILGARADWLTDMGEALTVANQGLVTSEARQAFEAAAAMDAEAVKPRFFLAIALGQEGRTEEAIAAWEQLLEGADKLAAWVGAARQQLAQLKGEEAPADGLAAGLKGPSQEDIAAAGDMSDDDRQAMIRNMVTGLAERLSSEGGTAEEWNRLIRAYMVLGDKQKAETAYADAQAALDGKPDDLSMIKDVARQLGLSGS